MRNISYYIALEELGVISRELCSEDGHRQFGEMKVEELPDNIIREMQENGTVSYWRYNADISESRVIEIIFAKNALNIRTIKTCAVIFTVIAVLSRLGAVISILSAL
ncbi:MAG: hypothetical protein GX254_02905 [Clostridiales bacterium]|jgi:hypothetical protein|nr:hypothetical protein [Clostridiales bacterium]